MLKRSALLSVVVVFCVSCSGPQANDATGTSESKPAAGELKVLEPLTAKQMLRAGVLPVPIVDAGPGLDAEFARWQALGAVPIHMPQFDYQVQKIDGYQGDADASLDLHLLASKEGLWIGVEAQDDVHYQEHLDPDEYWRNDSLQIGIDPLYVRNGGGYCETDRESTFALTPKGASGRCDRPEDAAARTNPHLMFSIKRVGQRTLYRVLLPWEGLDLKRSDVVSGRLIGLNINLNESDDGRREGCIEWSPGMFSGLSPAAFPTLILVEQRTEKPALVFFPEKERVIDRSRIRGKLFAWVPGDNVQARVRLQAFGAKREVSLWEENARLSRGVTALDYEVDSDALPEGDYTLRLSLSAGGKTVEREASLERYDAWKRAEQGIGRLDPALPEVEAMLKQAEEKGLSVQYPALSVNVVRLFVPYIREDIAKGQIERAVAELEDCTAMLERSRSQLTDALNGRLSLPRVPRFRTGKVEVEGLHFVADTEVPGTRKCERRPVFFNGYGHFGEARRTVPRFQGLGANVIQIECGPNSALRSETETSDDQVRSYILGGLEDCARHNVQMAFLLSPHYFPGWAKEKWPELGNVRAGFIRYTIDHPEARRIIEKWLRLAMKAVGGHPALHSVCLSNEPIYEDSRLDVHTQRLWHEWLKKKYGEVGRMNERWGTSHKSFTDVPIPMPYTPADGEHAGWAFDWVTFNQERFSVWHAWMRSIVREEAPGTLCHAKVMSTHFGRENRWHGTGAEDFARIGDLNGNDSWISYEHSEEGEWIMGWDGMYMNYDLQRSLKPVPICNTENHVIPDRETRRAPADYIHAVLWQQAIHGQGLSTIWVWERTEDVKSDFAGSILHRPGCVEAAGRAHLDLMRLSREVVALQEAEAPVAILYSQASLLHQDDFAEAVSQVYAALTFSGLPARFISDRKLCSREWEGVRLIVLANASRVPREAVDALRQFARSGRIVAVGDKNLLGDTYGKPLSPSGEALLDELTKARLPLCEHPRDLFVRLMPLLKKWGLPGEVRLVDPMGGPAWGVEYRCCRWDGKWLVNALNLTRQPVEVKLLVGGREASGARDLISEQAERIRLKLHPLEPKLLVVTP